MLIIEIEALDNGAHRNQSYFGVVPPDWGDAAIIRESTDTLKNFPFGTFEVEEVNGVPTMIMDSWVPLPMPDPEPIPEPTEDDVWAELDAAYTEGVNSAYDQ